jgi:AcrR family transcriptional regulator
VTTGQTSTGSADGAPSTREQLLRAAIEIAGEQGRHMVTHRSVAARANVAHGLVRHYFGNREDLLSEAVKTAINEDIDHVRLVTDDPNEFGAGLTTLDENWPRQVLQFEAMLNAVRGNRADEAATAALYERYLGEIRRTLESLGIDDPDGAWADFFLAALDGLVLQHTFFRSQERTAATLTRLREVLDRLARDDRS